uniref:Beta-defensin-like domain-containing protein n=1 Tax=Podarcis muralis TaxID=64176 RepID=A0A670I9G9_PODMU
MLTRLLSDQFFFLLFCLYAASFQKIENGWQCSKKKGICMRFKQCLSPYKPIGKCDTNTLCCKK